MNFAWTDDVEAFRREVREFARGLKTPELEAEIAEADEEEADRGPLLRKVNDDIDRRGWLRMCWPKEMGGQDRSPWYQFVMVEELQKAGIPYNMGTATMIGPAVERFGTDAQKAKYLAGLWSGEITCALGYSEPNAGTDLASLETSAMRDGDDWVINGQKIWTTGAHRSTHIWLAARTDPKAPKHRGISMLIVPLTSAGITVRPIWTMAGLRTNEVFFEDVRAPGDALIGEEGRGWYVAANALDHERVAFGGYVPAMQSYDRFAAYLAERRRDLLADRATCVRLAEVKLDIHVQRAIQLTNAAIIASGGTPTMQASMVKVWSTELRYRMNNRFMDVLGRSGVISRGSEMAVLDGQAEQTFRSSPVGRFGGGTNEVQRNIVAQRGLGLPR